MLMMIHPRSSWVCSDKTVGTLVEEENKFYFFTFFEVHQATTWQMMDREKRDQRKELRSSERRKTSALYRNENHDHASALCFCTTINAVFVLHRTLYRHTWHPT
jgi:hypothetical protein